MGRPVIVIGAGGHARVVIDALKLLNIDILGISDNDPALEQKNISGIPVIYKDQELQRYSSKDVYLVNGLGGVKDTTLRRRIYEKFKRLGFVFRQVIHPAAIISPDLYLAEGVQVMAGAVLQAGTHVNENSLINTKASLDHDCLIGPHVHIAPGVTVCGNVQIEEGVHVGSGATIIQGVTIGAHSLIGAAALVRKDVPPGSKVFGVPGRIKKL
jgi:sugar O-acyltransferase (sialic acid O-acetyltransferase NeuD family)